MRNARERRLFPRAAGQMMRVGEDTGTLDIQLENAAEYYGRELEYNAALDFNARLVTALRQRGVIWRQSQ